MRYFRFFLALVALTVTASGVMAQGGLDTTFVQRANFRDGPSLEWVILGTYEAGTPIRLDGQAYEGTWVRGMVADGTVGWVIVTALGISQAQASTLPTVWVDDPFTLPAPGTAQSAPAGAAENTAGDAAPAAEATAEAPAPNATPAPIDDSAVPLLPGERIQDAIGPAYYRWGDDDGRINRDDYFGGLAVYCVNSSGVPSDTYRGGGIQVLKPDGSPILYVPSGVILAGYQEINRTGQYVTLGQSQELWYGGQPVALYLLASGEFQVNAFSQDGKLMEFLFQGCRVVPKQTSDGCPPGWDRDEHGNCVFKNLY